MLRWINELNADLSLCKVSLDRSDSAAESYLHVSAVLPALSDPAKILDVYGLWQKNLSRLVLTDAYEKFAGQSDAARSPTTSQRGIDERPPLLRWPSRDADHLAIMALIGSGVGIYVLPTITIQIMTWWLAGSLLSFIAGVLLWLRLPHAKWLAVAACFCLAVGVFIKNRSELLSLNVLGMIGGLALIAFWLARIDYRVRFEDD